LLESPEKFANVVRETDAVPYVNIIYGRARKRFTETMRDN